MLSGSPRHPSAVARTSSAPTIRGPVRSRVAHVPALRVAGHVEQLPGARGPQSRTVVADPCTDVPPAARAASPDLVGRQETGTGVGECPLAPRSQIVCAVDAMCACPLSGRITDAERATMNGILDQAKHLSIALSWVCALVVLVAITLFVRWVG
jgi:hypothetical protein